MPELGVLVLSDDELQDTMDKISRMKVAELKDLCRALGERMSGKKGDLYNRVVAVLLNLRCSPDPSQQLAIRVLVLKRCQGQDLPSFQDLHDAIRLGSFRIPISNVYAPESRPLTPPQAVSHERPHMVSHKQSSGDSLPHRNHSLYFEESPFYRLVRLVHGTPQPCMPHHSRGICTINFTFSPDESRLFDRAQSPNSNTKIYLLSGRQSGASLTSTRAQIEYPLPMEIKVNSVVVAQNFKGIKGKPGTAKPADITLLISGENATNRIQIIYAQTTERYLIYVYFVERVACESIMEQIIAKPRINKAATILQVCAENEEEDDLVVSTSRVTLRDPLSYTRMKYPVQSLYCKHIQCFDGLIYLELQLQVPTWTCPICQEKIKVQDLAILEYFQDILDSVDQNTEQVEIGQDGSWLRIVELELHKLPQASVLKRPVEVKTPEPVVEVISLDSDLEDEVPTDLRAPLPPPSVPPPSLHERNAAEPMSTLEEQGDYGNPLNVDLIALNTSVLQHMPALSPPSGNNSIADKVVSRQVEVAALHSPIHGPHLASSPTPVIPGPSSAPLPPPLVPPPPHFRRSLNSNSDHVGGSSPGTSRLEESEPHPISAHDAGLTLSHARQISPRNLVDSNTLSGKSLKRSSLIDSASLVEHMHKVASVRGAQYARALDQQKRSLSLLVPPGRSSHRDHVGQDLETRPEQYLHGDSSSVHHRVAERSHENSDRASPMTSQSPPIHLLTSPGNSGGARLLPLDLVPLVPIIDGAVGDLSIHGPELPPRAAVSSLVERFNTLATGSHGAARRHSVNENNSDFFPRQYIPHGDSSMQRLPPPPGQTAIGQTTLQFSPRPSQPSAVQGAMNHLFHEYRATGTPLSSQPRVAGPNQVPQHQFSHHSLPTIPTQKALTTFNHQNSLQSSSTQVYKALSSPCLPTILNSSPSHAHAIVGARAHADAGRPIEFDAISATNLSRAASITSPDHTYRSQRHPTNQTKQGHLNKAQNESWPLQSHYGQRSFQLKNPSVINIQENHGQKRAPQCNTSADVNGNSSLNSPVRYAQNMGSDGSHVLIPFPLQSISPDTQSGMLQGSSRLGTTGHALFPFSGADLDDLDLEEVNRMKDHVITNLRHLKRDTASMTTRHQQRIEKMTHAHIQELHHLASTLDSDMVQHVRESDMAKLSENLRRDLSGGSVNCSRLREMYAKMIDANQRTSRQRLDLEQENEKILLQMAWYEQVEKFNKLYMRASEALNRPRAANAILDIEIEVQSNSLVAEQNRDERHIGRVQDNVRGDPIPSIVTTVGPNKDKSVSNKAPIHSQPKDLEITASDTSNGIENVAFGSSAGTLADSEPSVQAVGTHDPKVGANLGSVTADGMLSPANERETQTTGTGKNAGPSTASVNLVNEHSREHLSPANESLSLHSLRGTIIPPTSGDTLDGKAIDDTPAYPESLMEIHLDSSDVTKGDKIMANGVSESDMEILTGRVPYESTANSNQSREVNSKRQASEPTNQLLLPVSERHASPALFLDSDAAPSRSGPNSPGTPLLNVRSRCSLEQPNSTRNDPSISSKKGEKRHSDDQSYRPRPPTKRARPLASIIGFALSENALSWASRTNPHTTMADNRTASTTSSQQSATTEHFSACAPIHDPIVVDIGSETE